MQHESDESEHEDHHDSVQAPLNAATIYLRYEFGELKRNRRRGRTRSWQWPGKKRPPFSAGAKLPWFSRFARAWLAAIRRG